MRNVTLTIGTILLSSSIVLGANLPSTRVEGTYVEARTADVYTGACFGNSEGGIVGDLAVFGWKIDRGTWEGVSLDGLGVVGAVKASSTLGNITTNAYPVKAVLIVDERADAEQRLALKNFAQRMAGDLLQDIVKIEYRPINLEVENGNVHGAAATLSAGELARVKTRAINAGDHVCSNEEIWYQPLVKVDHAMPAYTLAHAYKGKDLNTVWSTPGQRSAFVATFNYQN
ncbi:MAG: DUF1326 domain-containing protein [Bryobacteraceae bacterium]|nr:DUF1326 domain-containing protein [Bryobacteraceae bacterium]